MKSIPIPIATLLEWQKLLGMNGINSKQKVWEEINKMILKNNQPKGL